VLVAAVGPNRPIVTEFVQFARGAAAGGPVQV
jgi:hypothetical protein